jgi:replicative DNA helicase
VLFGALAECARQDREPTAALVAVLAEGGDFGGVEYVGELSGLEVSPADLDVFITRLAQDAARDQARRDVKDLDAMLADSTVEHDECVAAFSTTTELLRAATPVTHTADVADRWNEEFDRRLAGDVPFVSTGYVLDEVLTEGFAKGAVTVVAGRPATGKSVFVRDCIRRLLEGRKKPRILDMALEGGPDRALEMLVANATETPVDLFVKRPHELTREQREHARRVVRKMAGSDDRLVIPPNPFYALAAKGKWTNDSAMDALESVLAVGGYDIAFFDLWERSLPNLDPQPVAKALVRMQVMTERYGVHSVVVHQLGRRFELERKGRKDRRPTLTDLKNSGMYEEFATLVLLLHREKMYKPFMQENVLEVAVAKQKRGEAGHVMLTDYRGDMCRLENDRMAGAEDLEPRATLVPGEED